MTTALETTLRSAAAVRASRQALTAAIRAHGARRITSPSQPHVVVDLREIAQVHRHLVPATVTPDARVQVAIDVRAAAIGAPNDDDKTPASPEAGTAVRIAIAGHALAVQRYGKATQ